MKKSMKKSKRKAPRQTIYGAIAELLLAGTICCIVQLFVGWFFHGPDYNYLFTLVKLFAIQAITILAAFGLRRTTTCPFPIVFLLMAVISTVCFVIISPEIFMKKITKYDDPAYWVRERTASLQKTTAECVDMLAKVKDEATAKQYSAQLNEKISSLGSTLRNMTSIYDLTDEEMAEYKRSISVQIKQAAKDLRRAFDSALSRSEDSSELKTTSQTYFRIIERMEKGEYSK